MIRMSALSLVFLGVSLLVAAPPPITTINPVGYPAHSPEGGKNVVRVWYNKGKWYLRTSTEDSEKVKSRQIAFTGTVRSEDRMTVVPERLEKNRDGFTMHPDGKGFDFRFTTSGGTDTVVMTLGPKAKTIAFSKLKVNNDAVEPSRIVIGAFSKCPDKADFVFPAVPGKSEPNKSDTP